MSDYQPTRACPHRLCRPLHLGAFGLGIVLLAQLLFHGIAPLLFAACVSVIGTGIGRLIVGKSLADEQAEEDTERAAGVVLIVRPAWAATAVSMDALMVLFGGSAIAILFWRPGGVAVPAANASGLITIGVVIGLSVLDQLAHWQATRPGRPKRAPLPDAA